MLRLSSAGRHILRGALMVFTFIKGLRYALAAALATIGIFGGGTLLPACSDYCFECQSNVLTVIFKNGVTRAQVDAINAEIDAVVDGAPSLSTAYRIRPPFWMASGTAYDFYHARAEVQAVLPSISYSAF
jgi:hypothetical protein